MNRPPITLRTMNPSDWELYRSLRLRSLADSPDAYGSTLAAEQERTPEAWSARLALAAASGRDHPLVAEQDDVPAGLVWAKFDPAEAGVVHLFQMWVAPEQRGRGVGAALLAEALAWARANGSHEVRLGVESANAAARQLYARAGFVTDGAPIALRAGSHLMEQPMRLAL